MAGELGSPDGRRSRQQGVILLDTHVIVWMVDNNRRLGAEAIALIETAPAIFFSAITAWELSMLVRKSRLILTKPPRALLQTVQGFANVREVALDSDIAHDAGEMDWAHRDPADRLIVATARALDCPLLTADEAILAHAAAGHLKAIDARV